MKFNTPLILLLSLVLSLGKLWAFGHGITDGPFHTYYVSNSGDASNSGLSEADSWPLEKAVSFVKPGDVVYVKAGPYLQENSISFNVSGTSIAKIKWIGYRNTPGDINADETSDGYSTYGSSYFPITMDNYNKQDYMAEFDEHAYPTFFGDSKYLRSKNSSLNNLIKVNASYNEFHNLFFTQVKDAIRINGTHNTLNNVICYRIGDLTVKHYGGKAIVVGRNANYTTIKRCFVQDAGAEGITIMSDYNHLSHNTILGSAAEGNEMDYYVVLGGSQTDINQRPEFNLVEHNRIFNVHNGNHHGHGTDLKAASNNVLRHNTYFRTNMEIMFNTSTGNLLEDSYIYGNQGGVRLHNGCNNNTLVRIHVNISGYKILGIDAQGTGGSRIPEVYEPNGPHHNYFIDCIFTGGATKTIGIGEFKGSDKTKRYGPNFFYNCNFINNKNFLSTYLAMDEPYVFVNCIISGIGSKKFYREGTNSETSKYRATFENCLFWDNDFALPATNGKQSILSPVERNPQIFIKPSTGMAESRLSFLGMGKETPYRFGKVGIGAYGEESPIRIQMPGLMGKLWD